MSNGNRAFKKNNAKGIYMAYDMMFSTCKFKFSVQPFVIRFFNVTQRYGYSKAPFNPVHRFLTDYIFKINR